MYWYEKAADQGYLQAYQNMGIVYHNGLGDVPIDYDKAFICFKKQQRKKILTHTFVLAIVI